MWGFSEKLLEAIRTKAEPPAGPLWVQLEISNRCNVACSFCAMHGPGRYTMDGFAIAGESDAFGYDEGTALWLGERLQSCEMSLAVFRNAVDQTRAEGAEDFNLCGLGEPTLNLAYPDMIKYIRETGARVSLDTNGSRLLTPGAVEKLIPFGLHGLHVSVNAASEATYRRVNGTANSLLDIREMLHRLARAKKEARSEEPHLLLSMVVTKDNCSEIDSFVRLAASVEARQVVFDHMVPSRLTASEVPTGEDRKRTIETIEDAIQYGTTRGINVVSNYTRIDSQQQYKIPCIVGYLFTRVMADGTVAGCCGCSHSLGKMPEKDFRSIWYGEPYRAFRAEEEMIHITHVPVTSCLCGSCPHVETNYEFLKSIGCK
ncbi:MAG: radical SAM protein [Deltaproteobacteria bacterium]|nr:radical SAM protein [Deltaproteobacteria bacterium]